MIKIPAYIHIPKTGGTYLGQLENNSRSVLKPCVYLGHCYIVQNSKEVNPLYSPHSKFQKLSHQTAILQSEINKHIVFATVRNIFDWLVSYAAHAGGWNPKYRDLDHYDFHNSNKGFDYLLNTIANRENIWPNRKFIFFQLFGSNGQFVADWLNRNETLDQDLNDFAQQFGYSYRQQPKQRVGIHRHYKEYYTASLIELVQKTWGRELKLYGYSFDGSNLSEAIIKRKVDPKRKQAIRYDLTQDKLTIDGMIKNG